MILSLGLIGHRGQYSDAQQEYERAQPRSSKPYRNQVGKVKAHVNDDGCVQFYFDTEHHLLLVQEKQPCTYRCWIVALDRWRNRGYPTFLKHIPFCIRIYNLPNPYHCHGIVRSIGSKLGQVDEISIIEPTTTKELKSG
ncbi:hypothetical protein YC2023_011268 [Brassica napus]